MSTPQVIRLPAPTATGPRPRPVNDVGEERTGRLIPLTGEQRHPPRVIAITSGKGGVGKTVIAANLGVCLAREGRRVLLVDADLALANLDLRLGVRARRTVEELLRERCPVEDLLVEGPEGVRLLPACSGDVEMAELAHGRRLDLFNAIDTLEERFDTVVVDTGAGVGSNALAFAAAAQQVVVVASPDPASIADAYAMMKVLSLRCGVRRVHLVVNMADGPRQAEQVVDRILGLVGRFLDISVVPVGYLYRDEAVERSVARCEPLVTLYPDAAASGAVRALSRRLIKERPAGGAWGGPRIFWRRIMGLEAEVQ